VRSILFAIYKEGREKGIVDGGGGKRKVRERKEDKKQEGNTCLGLNFAENHKREKELSRGGGGWSKEKKFDRESLVNGAWGKDAGEAQGGGVLGGWGGWGWRGCQTCDAF